MRAVLALVGVLAVFTVGALTAALSTLIPAAGNLLELVATALEH